MNYSPDLRQLFGFKMGRFAVASDDRQCSHREVVSGNPMREFSTSEDQPAEHNTGLSIDGLSLSIKMASTIFERYAARHRATSNVPHLLMALSRARSVLELE